MPNEDGTPTQEELDVKAAADAEAAKKTATTEVVSKADFDKLATNVVTLATSLQEAGKRLEVIDKVAAMLTGKEESTLTKEEQAVVGELKRLMPHILPNAKALDTLPQIQKVVEGAAKATSDTLTNAAYAYQLELQQEVGMKIDDPKANYFIGTAIREWINQDETRRARFWRGDRGIIQEGFKEVHTALAGPLKSSDRRTAAATVLNRPKNSAPAGGAGAGEGARGLDYSDKKAVRDAFKAALTAA